MGSEYLIENLEYLIEIILSLKVLVIIIPIAYFIALIAIIAKISKQLKHCEELITTFNEYNTKTNDLNLMYFKQYTTQLERIAKALEEEPEPYIIEKEDE